MGYPPTHQRAKENKQKLAVIRFSVLGGRPDFNPKSDRVDGVACRRRGGLGIVAVE